MDIETYPSFTPGQPAPVAEGLDALLAMLLLARRVHVNNLSLAGQGSALVELNGEAIENGLAAMAQYITLTPPSRVKQAEDDHEAEAEETSPPGNTVWQALKAFALPPPPPPPKKKKK